MKKLLLILLFAPIAICEAAAQGALRDSLVERIEDVVVTASGRNRARKYFRRYVRKVPLQGWYVGFNGSYRVEVEAFTGWHSQGEYERNHIPGDDANRGHIELFKLRPGAPADSVHSWQIQRYILLVTSIAEQAAVLGQRPDVKMSYRGLEEGRNIFLISEPGVEKQRGLSTRILVNDATGLVARSESVSLSPSGSWNVTADYALFEDFIYPTRVAASFEQRGPRSEETESVSIEITGITPRRFTREAENGNTWENSNDPNKVMKKKVRDKLLRM
jgi:hypothetical protein